MMATNRFRLRHLAREGHKGAKRVTKLLTRPDRLLGAILIGNTFANILAASIATVLAVRLWGDYGIFLSTILLTLVVLIFSEVTPKTLAALYPERFAYVVSIPLQVILWLFYPLVLSVNLISNSLLFMCGVSRKHPADWQLNLDELRTLVHDSGYKTIGRNKDMLLRLIDLKGVTVDDIMVPRSDIVGIDLNDGNEKIRRQMSLIQHTRLPVFVDEVDALKGTVHTRALLPLLLKEDFTERDLLSLLQEPYFVPEGTPLTNQLINFQQKKLRMAFVVDEYGDIQGLVTMEDILEEIVGEFTTDVAAANRDVYPEEGGSYVVDGSASIRELNRDMGWSLPTDGPKTVNGLILDYLESIPDAGTGCRLSGYPIEIIQIKDNAVKTVRIYPHLRQDRGN